MRVQRWAVFAGCLLISVLGTSVARAGGGGTVEGGTISFVGAVVAPTCSIAANPESLGAIIGNAGLHSTLQQNCYGTAGAAQSVPDPSRIYAVDVEHLSSAEPDHVLNYFANYVRAEQTGSADPVLVTQSFE
jgi:type 1 fimbria pilin